MSTPWVAFYSVRGGVGRSTTLTLVALELARRGRRVAVVDFDLESPGLDVLMTRDNARSPESAQPGVVDFLDARARGKDFRVDDIIVPLDLPGDYTGRLFLVPAGRCDDRYLEALDRLDLKQMYERSGLLNPVRQLRVELEATLDPDVVLIDSRTGYSDAALVTLFDLADAAVIIMVPDLQNVERLAPVLQRLVRSERKPELLLVANKCQLTPPAWRAVANIELRLRELVPVAEEDVDEVESPFLYKLPFLSEFTWVQRLLPPPVPSDALRQLASRVDTLVEAQAQPPTLIPKPPPSSDSLVRRQELLERLRFGRPTAQDDDRLFDAFVLTRNVKEALKPDRWLVRGARGSGKTALFRLLAERPFEASGYCSALEDWRVIIALGHTARPQSTMSLSPIALFYAERVIRKTNATWDDFWRLNAVGQAVRAQPALATTELRREAVALTYLAFSDFEAHLGMCLAKGSRIWADEFKSLAPKEGSPGLMFIYDNIDIDNPDPSDEKTALESLRGLINIWKPDATLALNGRMIPKILMREDIFTSMSSEMSLQAWRLHDVQLRWEVGEIAGCVVNRAKVDTKIHGYLREYEGALHHLPSGETRDFAVLFDERVGVGDKRARTWQMAARRLVDAEGSLFPSDFIRMAIIAQGLEKRNPSLERSFEPALIAGKHLLEAITEASNARANRLKQSLDKYVAEEAFLKCLVGLHSPFHEEELLSRLITAVEPERPEGTTREMAQRALLRLKRLGVVGEWADGRLFVAELYLQGLGMHRAGLKALPDDTPPHV